MVANCWRKLEVDELIGFGDGASEIEKEMWNRDLQFSIAQAEIHGVNISLARFKAEIIATIIFNIKIPIDLKVLHFVEYRKMKKDIQTFILFHGFLNDAKSRIAIEICAALEDTNVNVS